MVTTASQTAKGRIGSSHRSVRKLPEGTRRKMISGVVCPRCASEAIYRYGKTAAGHKRYLCQACRRQFTLADRVWLSAAERPACPVCGKKMHVYMRSAGLTRFRCSDYPDCHTFLKRAPLER
ncbi:MAG: hypothetical protein MUD16_11765 [Desulfobacterales bacterium]|nr:hypothetical protein [Desulfobacterales bacterium]